LEISLTISAASASVELDGLGSTLCVVGLWKTLVLWGGFGSKGRSDSEARSGLESSAVHQEKGSA